MKLALSLSNGAGQAGGGFLDTIYLLAYDIFDNPASIDDVSFFVYDAYTDAALAMSVADFANGVQQVTRARMTYDGAAFPDFNEAWSLISALSTEAADDTFHAIKDAAWRHFADGNTLEDPEAVIRGVSAIHTETLTATRFAERAWVIAYERAYRDAGIVGFTNDRDAIEAGIRAIFV